MHPVLVGLATLVLALPHSSPQAVPSPTTSSVDPCVVLCPAGDLTFHVTVRDLASNPIGGSIVVLNFGSCATGSVAFCPDPGPGVILDTNARTLTTITDAQGHANFTGHMGGGCVSAVRVLADGVQLAGSLSFASPDQDHNLIVNNADATIVTGKIGVNDPSADLTCSGGVDASDVAFVQSHQGHICTGVVGLSPQVWGKLKSLYR